MSIGHLANRVKFKFLWLKKYKTREIKNLLQHYWLLYGICRPMTLSEKSALIVAPHPDDESLGCAGLISLKREQGIPVQVVFITDGAASHSWHPDFNAAEMAAIRKQEALAALEILGVDQSQVYFLDKRDGKLKYASELERQQTIEQLAQLISSFQPGEVYVTHRHDRSNDHEVAYDLVTAAIALSGLAVELFQYPIWILWKTLLFWDVKLDELAGAHRLSIASVQTKKSQAIKTYRSQYSLSYGGIALPPGFLRRFSLPYEVFFKN